MTYPDSLVVPTDMIEQRVSVLVGYCGLSAGSLGYLRCIAEHAVRLNTGMQWTSGVCCAILVRGRNTRGGKFTSSRQQ